MNIFDETDPLIDSAVNSITRGNTRFGTTTTALALSAIEPNEIVLADLIEELWKQITKNWVEAGCRAGGSQNWRWKPQTNIDPENDSDETKLEKSLAQNFGADWVNQVPTSSGLITSTADRRRNIDLAHWDDATGVVTLIELKIESNTPVFAAFEIVRNGLLLCLARSSDGKIGMVEPSVWQKAKSAHLRVLAPRAFFTRFALGWFERELKRAVETFGLTHGLPMTFAFCCFDSPPKSADDLTVCLAAGSPYSS